MYDDTTSSFLVLIRIIIYIIISTWVKLGKTRFPRDGTWLDRLFALKKPHIVDFIEIVRAILEISKYTCFYKNIARLVV